MLRGEFIKVLNDRGVGGAVVRDNKLPVPRTLIDDRRETLIKIGDGRIKYRHDDGDRYFVINRPGRGICRRGQPSVVLLADIALPHFALQPALDAPGSALGFDQRVLLAHAVA